MERVSSLISKKVISVVEGKVCGYVLDLVFDAGLKLFEGCMVADDENEGVFFVRKKDFFSYENDVLMVESEASFEYDIFTSSNNPIGKNVYDERGVFLGVVNEVEISGKNVKKIITNKCEIPQKYIQKSGADFMIFGLVKNTKKNKNNLPIFKNKEKLNNFEEKMPKITINSQIINNSQQIIDNNQIRLFANPSILLGKILTNDLFGMNNEIIARKNQIIDKKIIKNAKNHNKLNILSYFSK